ncbi:MAG: ATPase, T2SS/T4P/T4SS family, partial [Patescibacteria group bacterium]
TARLAIQAALTGHLVFSTLHTNNAIAAIPRLIDMGIEPYLLAPTLTLIMAQRLVGTLCEESKRAVSMTPEIKKIIDDEFVDLPEEFKKKLPIPTQVYETQPSSTCSTGTRGRQAILELLNIDKEIQEAILKNPDEQTIKKIARSKGMLFIKEDAMLKAFSGSVAFDETLRM